MRLLNVVDVEATCWEGDPPPGEQSEIIEIGLAVVDLDAGERLHKHQIVVRPARSTVSTYCTDLTGLTQAEVEDGASFADACALLVMEYQARTLPWASWGDYDRKQFVAQCASSGVDYPFGPVHVNAKARFADVRGLRRPVGMAKALRLSGLPLEGRHHSGADDAWNIAALVLQLPAESVPEL
jgi:inhibitor of KinA sporulation pathway (predicted exonuclease)